MLAWLFGVILTLNWVEEVVTGIPHDVRETASLAGFETEQYVVDPLSEVKATEESPPYEPVDKVTVAAVTVSVPVLVWKVNESRSVAEAPGAIVTLDGSVPVAMVVVKANGVAGEPVGITPVEE